MSDFVVLGGSGSVNLAHKIARGLDGLFVPLITRFFPDRELYVRVPVDVEGRRIIYVKSMALRPNEGLVEFLFVARTLRELGASYIIGVIPYFPYARQDSRFKPGEVISLKVVADAIRWSGVDAVVTVDMHLHRVSDPSSILGIPVANVTVMGDLASYVIQTRKERFIVVGPDEEAEQWASYAAKTVSADYVILEKERLGDEEVRISFSKDIVADRVLLIDDIISTGSTIVEAIEFLKKRGVGEIYVACAHALLVSGADAKIFLAGARDLIASDTVNNPYAKVSSHKAIIKGIREVMRNTR